MKEYNTRSKRKRGVVLTVTGLKRFQTAILNVERGERSGKRFTQAELSDRIGVSTATLSRLWSLNSRIDPRTLRICFSAFDLRLHEEDYTLFHTNGINCLDETWEKDEEKIDQDFSRNVGNADLFPKNELLIRANAPPSQLVSQFVGAEKFSHGIALKERSLNHNQYKLGEYCKYPSGPLHLDSPLYIPRPPLEEIAYQEIMQPGCVISVKGCRKMGKTSLILRILAHARMLAYKTVKLNINQVDIDVLQNPQLFWQWLAASISRKLGKEFNANKHWDEDIGSKLSCTLYLKECLLAPLEKPVLLVVDEVQNIFAYPDLARDILNLLRSWQEEAQQDLIWQKLRLAIVYSTDMYLNLDTNQSVFDIGLPLKLLEFTYEQVIELATRYGMYWRENNQAQQLMKLVGGHPALINLALYHLCCQEVTLEEILRTASTQIGIYRQHLQCLLTKLQQNPQLLDNFKRIIVGNGDHIPLDPLTAYKLENMGLIRFQQQEWIINCELYRDFFREYLIL